jgi:site-specific recombinase XerD
VKLTHLRGFLAEEQKRRPAVSSQARATAALKLFFKHLDSTQRYTRVNAHELRGAIKRLRWVGG